jgi:hypothetical protein
MKRILFFIALIGMFLSVDAGTRVDVDVGMDFPTVKQFIPHSQTDLTVNVDIYQEIPGPISFDATMEIGARNPGVILVESLAANYDFASCEDTQGVMFYKNFEIDFTLYAVREVLLPDDDKYVQALLVATSSRNDLKRKGACVQPTRPS